MQRAGRRRPKARRECRQAVVRSRGDVGKFGTAACSVPTRAKSRSRPRSSAASRSSTVSGASAAFANRWQLRGCGRAAGDALGRHAVGRSGVRSSMEMRATVPIRGPTLPRPHANVWSTGCLTALLRKATRCTGPHLPLRAWIVRAMQTPRRFPPARTRRTLRAVACADARRWSGHCPASVRQ